MTWTPELQKLAIEHLVDLGWAQADFRFAFVQLTSEISEHAIIERHTGSYFALDTSRPRHFGVWYNPGEGCFLGRDVLRSKSKLLSSLEDWAEGVKEQRNYSLSWPDVSGAQSARQHLLLSELEIIAVSLRGEGLPLSRFQWRKSGESWRLEDSKSSAFIQLDVASDRSTKNLAVGLSLYPMPGFVNYHTEIYRASDPDNVSDWRHRFAGWASEIKKLDARPGGKVLRRPILLSPIELSRVHLKNIRGFEDFTWSSPLQRRPLLLIGPNGTGKSTFLRCLALAVLPKALAQSLLGSPLCRLLRNPDHVGRIEVELGSADGPETLVCEIESGRDGTELIMRHDAEECPIQFQIYGYGAGRAMDGASASSEDALVRGVATLFQYHSQLVDPETFFLRLRQYYTDHVQLAVQASIRALLDLSDDYVVDLSRQFGVAVKSNRGVVPLASWADGYRLTLQWLIDFWHFALDSFQPDPPNSPTGLLLIDELELHLHPKLQSRLLHRLTKALPNMHCIATTHSPLVALSVDAEQLLHLRNRDGQIQALPAPDLTSYSIEDVFTDPDLFDVSPYSPETQARLERWRALSAMTVKERTDEEQHEYQLLARWLASA
ncbi:AAA family ATPase [bacterium]|nr:AAA family ATPase [bacterium]